MSTEYHAKFFAYKLTLSDAGTGRLDRALFDASVDLNPHQIEAALFALKSPLSQGAILADEVGLGKTIEAGLVLAQYWAERQRTILIICPASLQKQWENELSEKFNLPVFILDAKVYKELLAKGIKNPWQNNKIVICSMDYCAKNCEEVKDIAWDLVVIDEAHRLRNLFRNQSGKAVKIHKAIMGSKKKLLLTATPLQNKLEEFFGLSTFIDETIFGGLESFRAQYCKKSGSLEELRARLSQFCKRTLRKDVQEFIKYTKRSPLTFKYFSSDLEHDLYEKVSTFLQRDASYALPRRQRHLLILLVRKLLGSSTQALIGTLEALCGRLRLLRTSNLTNKEAAEQLIDACELDEDAYIEAEEDEEDNDENVQETVIEIDSDKAVDQKKLDEEIRVLESCIQSARVIKVDTKLTKLKQALQNGFDRLLQLGAQRKVVIFTESRRTQQCVRYYLEKEGYYGKVITFDGSNTNSEAVAIYERWIEHNKGTSRATGSRAVDMRTALIEAFRNEGEILIATEAAAEGINLQFCSLVVNYDLPWNPQRIEQRIGRCHRYGQKHDVVVINFINERNEIDRRLHELLNEKINLFSGLFGVSDEVLGSIANGVDFEKRILDIYQSCRHPLEIEKAFNQLVIDMKENIDNKMVNTRKLLLENFDSDIHDKFKVNLEGTHERLDRMQKMFWKITKYCLNGKALFDDIACSFTLNHTLAENIPAGNYHLINKKEGLPPSAFLYRFNHPLGEMVLERSSSLSTPQCEVTFNYSANPTRIAAIESLKGKSGWLHLQKLCIEAFDSREYLLFSGFDSSGRTLSTESCEKLFLCDAIVGHLKDLSTEESERLNAEALRCRDATISKNREENQKFYKEKDEQYQKWADDLIREAEKEVKAIETEYREAQRRQRQAETIEEQKSVLEAIQKINKEKKLKRQQRDAKHDEIDNRLQEMLDQLDAEVRQKTSYLPLFTIHWRVI